MTQRIALVTDSTCDIPQEWRDEYEISVVPLTIILGEQQYLDGINLTGKQFYEMLAKNPGQNPSTSQPSPQAFLDVYRRLAAAGAEQIVVFTISAAMSGTIASARQAAADAGIPVEVQNSNNNSMGLGWQVLAAARARQLGGGVSEMLAAAQAVRQNMVYYITLDTIDYLSRGGRIAEAARFLNSVLNIKPLIFVRADSGSVAPGIPARSRKSALEGVYKEFFRHVDGGRPLHIAVMHNNAPEDAQELAERVKAEYAPKEMVIGIPSPVLGAHTGPRAVALCGYAET